MIGGKGAEERFLMDGAERREEARGKDHPLGLIRDLPDSIKRRPRALPYRMT